MVDRLDVLHGREGAEKTYWTKIGAAFPSKDGTGYNIVLDYIPAGANDRGQFQMILRPPKQKKDVKTPKPGSQYDQAPLDDNIPF